VPAGDALELAGVAADQDGIGHHPVATGEEHAALVADRTDRPDEVLVVTHPPGDAVHDQAETPYCHLSCSPWSGSDRNNQLVTP